MERSRGHPLDVILNNLQININDTNMKYVLPEHDGLLIAITLDGALYSIRAATAGNSINLGTSNSAASKAYLFYN